MLGDPVGPVRIAPLVAPVRAVLARPCGPSDTLLGPLDRAIAPGFRFVRALGEILCYGVDELINRTCMGRSECCFSDSFFRIRCSR